MNNMNYLLNYKIGIIALLISLTNLNAQDNYWSVYVPLHTTHFSKLYDDNYGGLRQLIGFHEGYLGSEGGQGGLLVSYNKYTKKGNLKTNTIGITQNSFGDVIGLISIGRVKNFKKWRLGIEVGLTYGYGHSFEFEQRTKNLRSRSITDFAIETNFYPVATSTIAFNITKRFGLKFLVNHIFINAGINYQFK